MTHFHPQDQRAHARANEGYDVADFCVNCGAPFMEHHNSECPTVKPAWSARTQKPVFFDDNPEYAAGHRQHYADLVRAHNACHDWLDAHPGHLGEAPDYLTRPLREAEQVFHDFKRRETDLFLAACKRREI